MSDLMAEKAMLGAILAGYPDLADLASTVQPADLEHPLHEEIYSAAIALNTSGTKVDPITVRTALGNVANRLPGGPTYLVDLLQAAPNVMAAGHYALEVKAAAVRHQVAMLAVKIGQLAETDLPVDELTERVRTATDHLTQTTTRSTATNIRDALPEVIDIAEHGRAVGIPSPWPELNHLITGFAPGRLVVIGARPGGGKSVMGSNIALGTVRDHQQPVLFCTMEMSAVEVTQRILAAHARVDLGKLEHGTLDQRSWGKIAAKLHDIHEWPLIFDDTPRQSLTSIRASLHRARRAHGNVPITVVDYLQLVTPRDASVKRHEQLGEITRGLKEMSREFETCVVAMAQVNRASTQRDRPGLADLRESGSIENDADAVILLHREPPTETDIPPLEAIVAKQRNGPTGMAELAFIGHYAHIGTYTRHQEKSY